MFEAIHFESLKILMLNSQIVSLNRNRSIYIEEKLNGWMFLIVHETKFFKKPECYVTLSSAMTHPYKCAIADVLSGRNIFSIVDPSYNKLFRSHGILYDIIRVRKWVEKIRKLRFSQFCMFSLYYVCFPADPNQLSL